MNTRQRMTSVAPTPMPADAPELNLLVEEGAVLADWLVVGIEVAVVVVVAVVVAVCAWSSKSSYQEVKRDLAGKLTTVLRFAGAGAFH